MLQRDWLGSFRQDGFCSIGQILTKEELGDARAAYERLFFTAQGTPAVGVRDFSERVGKPLRYAMMNKEDIYREVPLFAEIVRRPALLDIAEAILEDDIRLYHDEGFWKPALYGEEACMHQDNVYWRFKPAAAISVWIALDNASVESGCLHYIPGSHRTGKVKHVRADGGESIMLQAQGDRDSAVPVEVPAGHAIVHHCLTLHYSPPNRMHEQRRAYAVQYLAGRAKPQKPTESLSDFPLLRHRGPIRQAADRIRRFGRQASQSVIRLTGRNTPTLRKGGVR